MGEIKYTPSAAQDLRYFKKHEQKEIVRGIKKQLPYEPTVETCNRFRMRPMMWRSGNYISESTEYYIMSYRKQFGLD
jgi:hypothetical protein